MLEAGLKNTVEEIVTEDKTAAKVGSGLLPVYATPSMLALVENCCASCVQPYLEDGKGTVGGAANLKHLAPSAIGAKIHCECELKEVVKGRKLIFDVKVYDGDKLVGVCEHVRAVIDNKQFMENLKK